ncbi:neuromedin-U receptor 2 [Biomphalaria pfeifferi]|uniref:Neuromedin-U receptor 2 n=1 Tax=Biomphalaria pfeifferi TaxID=112525 RepID=A0AAD8F1J1_BIOPF|nr:neuromedin-U receptor 2 [Biomphalaria pfeifferi]
MKDEHTLINLAWNTNLYAINVESAAVEIKVTVVLDVTTKSVAVGKEYVITVHSARFAIYFVLAQIFCIFGFRGKFLNINVLRSFGSKDSKFLLLKPLILADLLLSVLNFFLHIHYMVECNDFVVASLVGTFSFVYLFVPQQVLLCVVNCRLTGVIFKRIIPDYVPFNIARLVIKITCLVQWPVDFVC